MLPLAALSVAIFAKLFDLFVYLSRLPIANLPDSPRELHEMQFAAFTLGQIPLDGSLDYMRRCFRQERLAAFDTFSRRIRFVERLVMAAPLLGLLGTVMGMYLTFQGISLVSADTMDYMANGVSQALVTTQVGLVIALPGLFGARIARRWHHRLEARMAQIESNLLASQAERKVQSC